MSRIGTGDDMENNLSAFSLEMKDVLCIFEHLTSSSLILIDELGRSSSNVDGMYVHILFFLWVSFSLFNRSFVSIINL
jgi:DNA mismatch repair ATPase MutS